MAFSREGLGLISPSDNLPEIWGLRSDTDTLSQMDTNNYISGDDSTYVREMGVSHNSLVFVQGSNGSELQKFDLAGSANQVRLVELA